MNMAAKHGGVIKFGKLILASVYDFSRMVGWVKAVPYVMMGYLNLYYLYKFLDFTKVFFYINNMKCFNDIRVLVYW